MGAYTVISGSRQFAKPTCVLPCHLQQLFPIVLRILPITLAVSCFMLDSKGLASPPFLPYMVPFAICGVAKAQIMYFTGSILGTSGDGWERPLSGEPQPAGLENTELNKPMV